MLSCTNGVLTACYRHVLSLPATAVCYHRPLSAPPIGACYRRLLLQAIDARYRELSACAIDVLSACAIDVLSAPPIGVLSVSTSVIDASPSPTVGVSLSLAARVRARFSPLVCVLSARDGLALSPSCSCANRRYGGSVSCHVSDVLDALHERCEQSSFYICYQGRRRCNRLSGRPPS